MKTATALAVEIAGKYRIVLGQDELRQIIVQDRAEYEAAVIERVARLYRGVTLPVLGNVMVAIKSLREER